MRSISLTEYGKRLAHFGVDLSFPRNTAIACVSTAAGWLAYQNFLTYGPGWLAQRISNPTVLACQSACIFEWGKETCLKTCEYGGVYGIAPSIVPELVPWIAPQVGLTASLIVSTKLNLLALLFFGIKAKLGPKQHPLNALLPPPVNEAPSEPKENHAEVKLTDLMSADLLRQKLLKLTEPSPPEIKEDLFNEINEKSSAAVISQTGAPPEENEIKALLADEGDSSYEEVEEERGFFRWLTGLCGPIMPTIRKKEK